MAVMTSVTGNAIQTPSERNGRQSSKAAGIMMIRSRRSEIIREGIPALSPSSAPQQVTEIADTMKPRLIMCIACTPIVIVAGFAVKIPISAAGTLQLRISPRSMIAKAIMRAVIKIFFTRRYSFAP